MSKRTLENITNGINSNKRCRSSTAEQHIDEEKLNILRDEGWLTDPRKGKFVGCNIRLFYSGYGKVDGQVVAYLPPEKNDGVNLWHVKHNDDDSEDISDEESIIICKSFFDNDESPPKRLNIWDSASDIALPVRKNLEEQHIDVHKYWAMKSGIKLPRIGSNNQVDDRNIPETKPCMTHKCISQSSIVGLAYSSEFESFLISAKIFMMQPGILIQAKLSCCEYTKTNRVEFNSKLVCVVKPPADADGDVIVYDGSDHHCVALTHCTFPLCVSVEEELHDLWRNNYRTHSQELQPKDCPDEIDETSLIESCLEQAKSRYTDILSRADAQLTYLDILSILRVPLCPYGDLWDIWTTMIASSNAPGRAIKTYKDLCYWYPLILPTLVSFESEDAARNQMISLINYADTHRGLVFDFATEVLAFGDTSATPTGDVRCVRGSEGSRRCSVEEAEMVPAWGTLSMGMEDMFIGFKRANEMAMECDSGFDRGDNSHMLLNSYRRSYVRIGSTPVRGGGGARRVEQLDALTGKVLAVHVSGSAASRATGVPQSSVSASCRCGGKIIGGYIFKFAAEEEKVNRPATRCRLSAQHTSSRISVRDAEKEELLSSCDGRVASSGDHGHSNGYDYEAANRHTGTTPARKNLPQNVSRIEQIDSVTGEILATFNTTCEAALALGLSQSAISHSCIGRVSSVKGFIFRRTVTETCEYLPKLAKNSSKVLHSHSTRKRTVEQVDPISGAVLATFNSGADAARATGIPVSTMTSCCRKGNDAQAGGYIFRYMEDNDGTDKPSLGSSSSGCEDGEREKEGTNSIVSSVENGDCDKLADTSVEKEKQEEPEEQEQQEVGIREVGFHFDEDDDIPILFTDPSI